MSEEFVREVDEDIKEEERIKLWKKLFPYVVSISLGIIIFTSGYVFWNNYTESLNQQLGDDFTAAVQLANEEDLDASILALDRIVDEGSDGYVTLAKMKKASLLIQRGELELGLNIYLDLERNAVDQSFRDIASILYVLNSMDTEDPKALLEKINKLESSQIWRSSALEMKAFLKLKQNKIEEARKIFEGILNLPSTPSSLATRAKNMVDYLKD
ncbi:tetratricopeptide repeat protein [Alphaproteobacteria bacterium]|nr:tetratricopeptide repeat protein [Alphaproteobacteria bacterium]